MTAAKSCYCIIPPYYAETTFEIKEAKNTIHERQLHAAKANRQQANGKSRRSKHRRPARTRQ